MNDITLGQIENDKNYNFSSKYDEDNDILTNDIDSCKYYEVSELKNKFSQYKQGFSTYSHNIRSINGHWDDILDTINANQPLKFSILAFQEIWSVQRAYEIPGYSKLEYNTRDKNTALNPNCGGGVGLYVDQKYEYELLDIESAFVPHVYESIWVKVKTKSGPDKIIGNVYRPNSAPRADLYKALEIHNQILDSLLNDRTNGKCEIIVCSDFNINMLNFESHNLTNSYINSLISKSFIPIITLPTRIKNQSATLIDHIWRSRMDNNFKSGILISSLSDHFPVFYIEKTKQKEGKPTEIHRRKFDITSTKAFCEQIKSTSWDNVTNEVCPKLSFNNFFDKMNSTVELNFPFIKVKLNPKKCQRAPWMTKGLFTYHKRKEKLFAKKKRCPSEHNIQTFKTFNSIYNKVRRQAKIKHYENQFSKFSSNIKKTWSVIKELLGVKKQKDQIPDFFRENENIINDYLEISNGFNTFFSKIGPQLAADIPMSNVCYKTFLPNRNESDFNFSKISETDILKICDLLKPKSSTGADFISTKLLKMIAPMIITPLHYLINLSLETGYVPREFKIAKVVPVFKSGDKHNYTNYRPISLLRSFSKLMERWLLGK